MTWSVFADAKIDWCVHELIHQLRIPAAVLTELDESAHPDPGEAIANAGESFCRFHISL